MNDNKLLTEQFKSSIVKQDLSASSIKGYLYDLNYFHLWMEDFYQQDVSFLEITTNDIRAYREHLSKIARQKPATINRRLQTVKRFYQWAKQTGLIQSNPSETINFARKMSPTRPEALNKVEVHALLTAAGKSSHGLDKRNYALVQLLLQAGLRIGEVTSLQLRDITIRDRSGSVSVVDGKGRKHRDVPLNATVRRALSFYLQTKNNIGQEDYVFTNKSGAPLSIRALQKVIKSLAVKANLGSVQVSAHTLRHTFATQYLQANPGCLVELAMLMGHESVDTTAIYTKASKESLAEGVERSGINLYAN